MRYEEIKPKLTETEEPDTSLYDPAQDELRQAHIEDTRKPSLTLRMVNRLKKMRASKRVEHETKQEFLGIMYGKPPADDEGL
jgi:hypothetical protein